MEPKSHDPARGRHIPVGLSVHFGTFILSTASCDVQIGNLAHLQLIGRQIDGDGRTNELRLDVQEERIFLPREVLRRIARMAVPGFLVEMR
jgi:hypothetical protein